MEAYFFYLGYCEQVPARTWIREGLGVGIVVKILDLHLVVVDSIVHFFTVDCKMEVLERPE